LQIKIPSVGSKYTPWTSAIACADEPRSTQSSQLMTMSLAGEEPGREDIWYREDWPGCD
jgi:hypothetical protein